MKNRLISNKNTITEIFNFIFSQKPWLKIGFLSQENCLHRIILYEGCSRFAVEDKKERSKAKEIKDSLLIGIGVLSI
jgi:hypothetical protein